MYYFYFRSGDCCFVRISNLNTPLVARTIRNNCNCPLCNAVQGDSLSDFEIIDGGELNTQINRNSRYFY